MLIRQIKIALSDIVNNIGSSLVFFVQIFLCFLLCGYAVSEFLSLNTLSEQLNAIGDINNIYYITDVTDISRDSELSEQEDIGERLYELYKHMQDADNYDVFRFYQTVCGISDNRMDTSLAVEEFDGMYGYNVLYADTKYLDLFGIQCSEGQIFDGEYIEDGDMIPVVAGSAYKKAFDLRDIIGGKYEIVGFIEENSFIININWSNELCYLDDYLIRPFSTVTENSHYLDIYQSIVRSLVMPNKDGVVSDIPDYSLQLGLYTLNMRSYAAQLENITEEVSNELTMIVVFMILIMTVCVVCMYTVLLLFINKHLREFTLHLMCGCTLSGILQRICFHILLPMTLSYILTMIIFRTLAVAIILALFALFLSIITLLPPILKIYKNSLISVIGRTE